jgi:hypothetical protein
MKESRCSIATTIVVSGLLTATLYVGSYLALVVPEGRVYLDRIGDVGNGPFTIHAVSNYRAGGEWAERIFLPLELIDRKLRPNAWKFRLQTESPRKWSRIPGKP